MIFFNRFIEWMVACLSSLHFACLINSRKSHLFKSQRSIRQGDSISPYLFILIQQIISCLKTISTKKIAPFNLKSIKIYHFPFVDDLILFFRANASSYKSILRVLKAFEVLTNLQVNAVKSNIYFFEYCPPRVRQEVIQQCS